MQVDKGGPLFAAIRAVVFAVCGEHGICKGASHMGIGVRTMNAWMRIWGAPPRRVPPVNEDDRQEVARVLGLYTEEDLQKAKEGAKEVVTEYKDRPVEVPVIPAEIKMRIERATELLLLTDYQQAMSEMLQIEIPERVV